MAGIVVSLAAAWALAELVGAPRSLNARVRRAPLFYGVYFASLGLAAALTERDGVPFPPALYLGETLLAYGCLSERRLRKLLREAA